MEKDFPLYNSVLRADYLPGSVILERVLFRQPCQRSIKRPSFVVCIVSDYMSFSESLFARKRAFQHMEQAMKNRLMIALLVVLAVWLSVRRWPEWSFPTWAA